MSHRRSRVGVEYRYQYYHARPNNAVGLPSCSHHTSVLTTSFRIWAVAEFGSITGTDPDGDPDQSFLGQRKIL